MDKTEIDWKPKLKHNAKSIHGLLSRNGRIFSAVREDDQEHSAGRKCINSFCKYFFLCAHCKRNYKKVLTSWNLGLVSLVSDSESAIY